MLSPAGQSLRTPLRSSNTYKRLICVALSMIIFGRLSVPSETREDHETIYIQLTISSRINNLTPFNGAVFRQQTYIDSRPLNIFKGIHVRHQLQWDHCWASVRFLGRGYTDSSYFDQMYPVGPCAES